MNKKYFLLFIILLAIMGYLVYIKSQRSVIQPEPSENILENTPTITPAISKEAASTIISVVATPVVNPKPSPNVFERIPPTYPVYSENIVGYIFSGTFLLDFPSWIADHWGIRNEGENVMIFYPRETIKNRDFSDIRIEIATTTESFNANTLYEANRVIKLNLIISEVFLNKAQDARVYHVSRKQEGLIYDTFYIDGDKKTGVITFSAEEKSYGDYAPKIREIIQGLSPGSSPQG